MDNPFTLTFGKEPTILISREQLTAEVMEGFLQEHPDNRVLMLTGVRGSGKTVTMTSISNEFRKMDGWIVIDLNPERDMLQMLAAELGNLPGHSFLGFRPNKDGQSANTDVSVALDRMLAALAVHQKKVLITIDEATSTERMRVFAAQFQTYLQKNYDVFLLMAGLVENTSELQNEKSPEFLYRALKIEMKPLSTAMIAQKYGEVFHLSNKEVTAMAKATSGYAYAFQLLGYLCFKRKRPYWDVLSEYDANLEQYVYEKIWSGLSEQDQNVLDAMTSITDTKVEKIRDKAGMSSAAFSVYRSRLIKKGLIRPTKYGHLELVLPRFREFVRRSMDY